MNRAALVVIFATTAASAAGAQSLQSMTSLVSVVHEYVPAASFSSGQTAIPSNLTIAPVYQALVDRMSGRSPTFRRQLGRIAAAPHLTVDLQPRRPPWFRGIRARTMFVREGGGRLSARIDIGPLQDNIELIAHELEHVIEQLDDIDLAVKAGRPNSGVKVIAGADVLFETTRATRVGLQVTHEVR